MDLSVLKQVLNVIKDSDLKIKIADLTSRIIDVEQENSELKKKIESLDQNEKINSKLTFEHNHYYFPKDTNKNTPYCSNCWDSKKLLIKLHKDNVDCGVTYYSCPNCKDSTKIGTYVPINNFAEDEDQ